MQQFDFSEPSRQSFSAILIIIFNLYKNWVKRLLPILAGVLFGSGKTWVIMLTLGLFVVIIALFGVIYFYKYTFYIDEDELIIQKGVFKRSKISIPFERIQSINFKQTIVHQVLSVVELEIDTAGSSKTEFDLQAISSEKANALRQTILGSKTNVLQPELNDAPITPEPIKLFKLTFGELIKVGLTQNHLRSGFIPVAIYFWLRDLLKNGGIELDEIASEYTDPDRIINLGLFIMGIIIILYALVALLISLVMSIIRYFDLTLYRQEDGFKATYGLITKRQITIKDTKIQIFKWKDNLLRKIPRIFNMQIKQAASAAVSKKTSSIHLAGVSEKHVHQFLNTYFTDHNYRMGHYIQIAKIWLVRQMVIISTLALIVLGLAIYFPFHPGFIFLAILLLLLYISSILYFRKKAFGINDEVIHIKGGRFGDENELIQIYKVQGVKVKQSPFQRRNSLASVVLYTAAGNLNIPYIPFQSAKTLRNIVLQIVETDQRGWM